MSGNMFRDKKPMINAFEVSEDDPEFLRPREFTFIFFTTAAPRARLLYDKHENYQQGTIQFSELTVTATEYMGRLCVHCKKPLTNVSDCCIATNQGQVVATVHETCFRKWFKASDKGQLSPYRLVRIKRQKLGVEGGGSFKVQVNQGTPADEYTFTALKPIRLEELAHDKMTGTIVQQPSSGYTGTPPQGISPDDYMLQMQTMVQGQGQEQSPPPAAAAAQPSDKPVPWQAMPPAQQQPAAQPAAAMSHSVKVEAECPHCRARLIITVETKG